LFFCNLTLNLILTHTSILGAEVMLKKTILIVIVLLAGLVTYSQFTQASARTARVNFIKGEVSKASGTSWVKIHQVGTILKESDKVKTGANSKVEIRFDDGSIMQLGSNSVMALKQYSISDKGRNSNIKLNDGSMFANVKKLKRKSSFKVSTVTAVAGVRGTEFYVSIDDKKNVKVEVYKGKVDVSKADDATKQVQVKAGYETEVKTNSNPVNPSKIKQQRKVEWEK
jgi:ferric-dicitrate binding protein FerR (iron transport regulator)